MDEGKGTQKEISKMFGVSLSFLEKLLIRRRKTGKIEAIKGKVGRKRKLEGEEMVVEEEVKKQADITLEELSNRIEERTGKKVSRAAMCQELKRLGYKRKKRVDMQKNKRVQG